MTSTPKDHDRLDKSDPGLQKRNEKFDQERAESLDRTKQSGKGEGHNTLAKPADEELSKP
ncbi:MAG: hypothetical protein ABI767_05050 [Rhodanobacter sp.]